jgi:hypothetical protein
MPRENLGDPARGGTHSLSQERGRSLQIQTAEHLPIIQATKFELVINLTTAKALGLLDRRLSGAAKEVVKDVISSIFQSDRLPQSN